MKNIISIALEKLFSISGKMNNNSSLSEEIINLERYLGIENIGKIISQEYLDKLEEIKENMDDFLRNHQYIERIFFLDYNNLNNEFLNKIEKEILSNNKSRSILLEDLNKLINSEISIVDFHVQSLFDVDYLFRNEVINILLSRMDEKNLLEILDIDDETILSFELKYEKYYINRYMEEELNSFPRMSGSKWKINDIEKYIY